MPAVRPVSDRITSHDDREDLLYQQEIDRKLMEASIESLTNPKRLSHEEVFSRLREKYPYAAAETVNA
jgi:hypothetical protein